MSLDVYLISETKHSEPSSSCIFTRENGVRRQISREEWDELHPGVEPVTFTSSRHETDVIYRGNITHNLAEMARAVGIYEYLWRPDELNIERACELITPLSDGIRRLSRSPEIFKKLNPENGWGNYDVFIRFLGDYLIACIKNPEARVEVSR